MQYGEREKILHQYWLMAKNKYKEADGVTNVLYRFLIII